MIIISKHNRWWAALVVGSVMVAASASNASGVAETAGVATGLLLFALLLASIPWLVGRLRKRPLTSEQFMWTFTVAWLLLGASQLIT